ncbi:MAG: hypothetical protein QM706_05220 [Nitrospira sp.]
MCRTTFITIRTVRLPSGRGIKTQEYKHTPNQYDWLPDYEAFTANFLLQLHKPTTIKRGDPIGVILPVLLPKQVTLQELRRPVILD